jgi:hypothetical protein
MTIGHLVEALMSEVRSGSRCFCLCLLRIRLLLVEAREKVGCLAAALVFW